MELVSRSAKRSTVKDETIVQIASRLLSRIVRPC